MFPVVRTHTTEQQKSWLHLLSSLQLPNPLSVSHVSVACKGESAFGVIDLGSNPGSVTFLCLDFLICIMQAVIIPISQDSFKECGDNLSKQEYY